MSILQEGDELKGAFGRLSVSRLEIVIELTFMIIKAKRCPMCTSWMDGRDERETSALPLNGH